MLKHFKLKPVLAGAALLAFAGSSYVYAQQGFGGHRGYGDGGRTMEFHHRMSAADMAAFTDARIAALKAGLELTPDQSKNWPPFEQAVRDMAQLRIQRIQARQAQMSGDQPAPSSPFDRLGRRADNMAKASAALKKVADAGAPLYQSLNDDQKDRFKTLARILRPHALMHGLMERNGHKFGEGYGRDGEGLSPHFERFGQNDGQQDGRDSGPAQDGRGDQDSQL